MIARMGTRIVDVLADQPFAEVGLPSHVVDDPAHGRLVVAGDLGDAIWFGYGGASRPHVRVGVYDSTDLARHQVFALRRPVTDVAVHPSGALVAVGTGEYDGGYAFEGELVLLDLRRGTSTSVLRGGRQVCSVRWLDDVRLRVTLAPYDDDAADDWTGLVGESFDVEAPWADLGEDALDLSRTRGVPVPFVYPEPDVEAARAALAAAAERAGRAWELRRGVWSVVAQADGSVLAGCEGVAAELWGPSGGPGPRWRRTTVGAGCQLTPLTTSTVLTTVELRATEPEDVEPWRSAHEVIDVATGQVLTSLAPGGAAITASAPGSLVLLRPAAHIPARAGDGLVADADGRSVGSVTLSAYDAVNHWFDVARAPAPLVLVGRAPKTYRNSWVARVEREADGPVLHRLFPLEWTGDKRRHLWSGPGVFVDDDHGPAIVHTGQVHSGSGRHAGFVVRRAYPDGAATWAADLTGAPTGADAADGVVAVTTVDGRLVLLDARTGAEVGSEVLHVDGLPVVPLSVSASGGGRIAVGLLDGRILRLQRT